jgi:S-adenosylmethionine decarboxylase
LIIDLYGASHLDDLPHIEQTLRCCIVAAGAKLLHLHLHHFPSGGGVTGVALLAESHISLHTWPEHNYGAFDVFMCGAAKPEVCLPILQASFRPTTFSQTSLLRSPHNSQ